MATKPHNYDKTQARRQRKRRALFNRMREALQKIRDTTTDKQSMALAHEGLDENYSDKDAD